MKKSGKSKASKSGMTILEVLVALFLLGLVSSGAYRLMINSARITRMSRNHYVAACMAR